MQPIYVSGCFDSLRSRQVRFLEAASRLGPLRVLLWSDPLAQNLTGSAPNFPYAEREYFLSALRFVEAVEMVGDLPDGDSLPSGLYPGVWAVPDAEANPRKESFCLTAGLDLRVLPGAGLRDFPPPPAPDPRPSAPGRKKVLVTGCYDWLHSGHVRFFEEAAAYGDLYVVAGNDANVRNLKGEGHPMQPQEERVYMIGAVRFVHQALVSSGWGWLDAVPEIEVIRPEIYLVNEDGDKPEKREFCAARGLEYVVLKRLPRPGLPRRSSTDLRGF